MKRDGSVTRSSTPFRPEELAVADPDDGKLGRNVAGRPIRVPKQVALVRGQLRWSWAGQPVPSSEVTADRGARAGEQLNWIQLCRNNLVYPTKGMLTDFINLAFP